VVVAATSFVEVAPETAESVGQHVNEFSDAMGTGELRLRVPEDFQRQVRDEKTPVRHRLDW